MNPYQQALHVSRGVQDIGGFHERLKADPVLAERLAYAEEHAVPPSILAGRTWPNPLDPTEPQWLPDDWSDVLTYRIWARGRCPQCGVHERDWGTDAEQPFIARARLCHGCAEVAEAREEHADHEHQSALRFALVPNDGDVMEVS